MSLSTPPITLYVSGDTWLAQVASGATPAVGGDRGSETDWSAVAATLLSHFHRPGPVEVLLSARLCRSLVLPWVSSFHSGKAIRAYVEDTFAQVNGITAQSHQIAIDWPAYGEPILAVAHPRALIDALNNALATAGFALAAVRSSIVPVLDRYGAALGMEPTLLAYAEDDGITAITLEDGRVAMVETLAGDGVGLDNVAVWCSRKRIAFSGEQQLRWLATGAAPASFPGTSLALATLVQHRSAGHALVSTCR